MKGSGPVTELAVGFDDASVSLTLTPPQPWTLGEFYWVGVRGYANGVRDAGGGEVVGSPTMALLEAGHAADLRRDGSDAPSIRTARRSRCWRRAAPTRDGGRAAVPARDDPATAYVGRHGFDVMAGGGAAQGRDRRPVGLPDPHQLGPRARPRRRGRSARPGRQTRSRWACRGPSIRRRSRPSSSGGHARAGGGDGPDRGGGRRSRRAASRASPPATWRIWAPSPSRRAAPFPSRAHHRALLHERASIRPTARRWWRRPCRCC